MTDLEKAYSEGYRDGCTDEAERNKRELWCYVDEKFKRLKADFNANLDDMFNTLSAAIMTECDADTLLRIKNKVQAKAARLQAVGNASKPERDPATRLN